MVGRFYDRACDGIVLRLTGHHPALRGVENKAANGPVPRREQSKGIRPPN